MNCPFPNLDFLDHVTVCAFDLSSSNRVIFILWGEVYIVKIAKCYDNEI
jgi:hypothetical protein